MKNKTLLKLLVLSSAAMMVACGGKGSSDTPSPSFDSSIASSEVSSGTSSSVEVSSKESSKTSSSTSKVAPGDRVSAKQEKVTIVRENEIIKAEDLFNISAASYTLTSSKVSIAKVSQDKKSLIIVHGGDVKVTIETGEGVKASCDVSIVDVESSLSTIANKLKTIKTGFNISGYRYENGSQVNMYKTYNPNYIYDNYKDIGYGVFKDGNVYKFRGNADGSFSGIGGVVGEATTWKKNLFKDFTVTNKYISKKGNAYYIPYNVIGSQNMNPLAKAFLDQVELPTDATFEHINLEVGDQGEISLTFVTGIFNGTENKNAEYLLADFGIAGIDDVEKYLASAEIPTVTEGSVEALKAVFRKYKNSKSYRIFGADITDTDHEIFYNYYSPNQYYEYFMNDGNGYINLDGKVYNYTADKNNHVVLGSEKSGISDYKEIVETMYTIDESIFDKVTYNKSLEYYVYAPTATDNALAKFLLHTCGYDTNGKDNFAKNVQEIAFLVEGDVVYVDINLNAAMSNGQIKFQFDRLDSVDMPQYFKPTEEDGEGKEYAGYYVGKGTMSPSRGVYETVESTLKLNANLTGIFTFNNVTYELTWSAKDNPSNQNQVNFTLVITSPTTKGESFEEVYLYKTSKNTLQVKFNYDSSITHISWNAYTLQA